MGKHLSSCSHLSLNREGRWGTRDDFETSFLLLSLFFTALWNLANPRPVHSPFFFLFFFFSPPLPLSALSSSPFQWALRDGFGKTWWTRDMTIPLQFVSLNDRQEVFVWSDCLLNLGMDFLVGNMVFVWDAQYLAVSPRFHSLHFSLELFCECPRSTSFLEDGCDKGTQQQHWQGLMLAHKAAYQTMSKAFLKSMKTW